MQSFTFVFEILFFNFWHKNETYSPKQKKKNSTILFKFWFIIQDHVNGR